jgi:hypothetical protein
LFKQDVRVAEGVVAKGAELSAELMAVNELLSSTQPRIAALLDSIVMDFYQIGSHGIDIAELVSGTRV